MNKKENLNNISLYKKIQLTSSITQTAVKEFVKMIQDYLIFCYNEESLKENKHKQFLINRGLNMLYYIFTTIFMYTKNLEITIYHCKKGFYYYIEFLGQIIEQDNTYLQLTSKDAILFVYKKTIFEINEQEKKNLIMTDNERKRLDMVYNTCLLYIDLTSYIFSNENIDSINIKKYHKKIKKNTKMIEKIINLKYFKELKVENINIISFFIEYMKTQHLSGDDFSQYIEYFINQLKDSNYSKELLQAKILNEQFSHNIKTYTTKKFIKWLIN